MGELAAITGATLRERRKALGLTMSELAAALGVHWNTISRWERGAIPIDRPAMLAAALRDLERASREHQIVVREQLSVTCSCGNLAPFPAKDLEEARHAFELHAGRPLPVDELKRAAAAE